MNMYREDKEKERKRKKEKETKLANTVFDINKKMSTMWLF